MLFTAADAAPIRQHPGQVCACPRHAHQQWPRTPGGNRLKVAARAAYPGCLFRGPGVREDRPRPGYSRALVLVLVSMFAVATPGVYPAETSDQVWANVVLGFPRSEKLYLEYDFEGAKQVSGGEPWYYLYGTGLVEYYPTAWFDITGEVVTTGATRQDRAEDSIEATFRAGFRLHLISQIFNSTWVKAHRPERMSTSVSRSPAWRA